MKRLLLVLLVSIGVKAQLPKEFQKQLDEAGLKFEMPAGYKSVPVTDNPDLQYSFAIENSDRSMEVRYSVFPMKPLLEAYKKSLEDKSGTMIDPNKLYIGINMANGLNMTRGEEPEIASFNPKDTQAEFHADWGGTSFFEFNCAFGKGWTFGQAVYLHKRDTADVIITFMSNDREIHTDLMDAPFHSLTFK